MSCLSHRLNAAKLIFIGLLVNVCFDINNNVLLINHKSYCKNLCILLFAADLILWYRLLVCVTASLSPGFNIYCVTEWWDDRYTFSWITGWNLWFIRSQEVFSISLDYIKVGVHHGIMTRKSMSFLAAVPCIHVHVQCLAWIILFSTNCSHIFHHSCSLSPHGHSTFIPRVMLKSFIRVPFG